MDEKFEMKVGYDEATKYFFVVFSKGKEYTIYKFGHQVYQQEKEKNLRDNNDTLIMGTLKIPLIEFDAVMIHEFNGQFLLVDDENHHLFLNGTCIVFTNEADAKRACDYWQGRIIANKLRGE